jgi:hypothetical protein
VVQVAVNAIGKKSSNVFPFAKFSLSLICFGPSAVFVDKVKSGALVPTASGISESSVCDFGAKIQYRFAIQRVKGDRESVEAVSLIVILSGAKNL